MKDDVRVIFRWPIFSLKSSVYCSLLAFLIFSVFQIQNISLKQSKNSCIAKRCVHLKESGSRRLTSVTLTTQMGNNKLATSTLEVVSNGFLEKERGSGINTHSFPPVFLPIKNSGYSYNFITVSSPLINMHLHNLF